MKESKATYAWVGPTLYKRVEVPTINGMVSRLRPWGKDRMINDHSRDFLKEIPRYDGFCNLPAHEDYQEKVGKFLNLYQPLPYQPSEEPGDFPHIRALLRHVFKERYELGEDYIQILYQFPRQKLPILLLVSQERNTGKTTFMNFLKDLFGANATFNSSDDFRSQFNADWGAKLLIMVDEALIQRREECEKIKAYSTATHAKVEGKGRDREDIEFFGKFVLASNNLDFPVIIDDEETRYWVEELQPLENDDVDMAEKLRSEIPAFLHYLKHRQLASEKKTRMWFSRELIETEAERRIKKSSLPKPEKDLVLILRTLFSQDEDATQLQFSWSDASLWAAGLNFKIENCDIRNVLQRWRVPYDGAGGRTYYFLPLNGGLQRKNGRFYTVTREFFESRFPDK